MVGLGEGPDALVLTAAVTAAPCSEVDEVRVVLPLCHCCGHAGGEEGKRGEDGCQMHGCVLFGYSKALGE